MAKKIVVLEDNADRRVAMQRCLEDRFSQFDVVFFDGVREMIAYLDAHLHDAIVICLDHDLELKQGPGGRSVDPGTGREVADYLAGKAAVCPVVIHTTNSTAAVGMEMALREARWDVWRVMPCGDLEWIPTQWFRTVRRAIVGPTRKSERLPQRSPGGSAAGFVDG
jgi:CheY-like chemotaxis protein